MQKILLVEDDQSLGTTLKALLEKEGFAVHLAATRSAACSFVASNSVDLAVLDVGLPDGNGFEVAAQIKSKPGIQGSSSTPIIFLSAMNSAEYRLKGFELGGDDYIPKPFHLRELLLRVSKVLPARKTQSKFFINKVIVDIEQGCIIRPDSQTDYLSRRDLQVLRILLNNAPAIVTREQILQAVSTESGNDSQSPNTRSIDNSIVRLRQLLSDTKCECIRSVRGSGYQWIAKEH